MTTLHRSDADLHDPATGAHLTATAHLSRRERAEYARKLQRHLDEHRAADVSLGLIIGTGGSP